MVDYTLNIQKLVDQPFAIEETDIKGLEQLSKEHPWCSSYQIILAKGYECHEHYLQNKQLRLASTYAANREQLFLYFKKQDSPVVDFKEDTVSEKSKANPSIKAQPILENKIDKASEKESAPKIIQEKQPAIDFDKIVTYNPIEELKVKEHKNKPDSPRIPIEQIPYNPEKELAKLIDESSKNEDRDFMYWINHIDSDEIEESKKTNKKSTKKTIDNKKSPDNVQNLLDQFLATKRSRPIQNRSFYNAQDKAEESETDKMNIVSETLLKIYIKQGHYDKAILGYEKLSLQNPNKSAYFAARIKEIIKTQNEL